MKIGVRKQSVPADKMQENGFFSHLFATRACQIPGCCPVLEYEPDTMLLREGSPAKMVYLVESGLVKMTQIQPDGRVVTAGIRGKDWLLGAPALLLGRTYGLTVTTLTFSLLRNIRVREFEELARTDREFSWNLCQMLSKEIKSGLDRVVELSSLPGKERLLKILTRIVQELHHCGVVEGEEMYVPLKQHELAELACLTPEHLCRVMHALEKEKIVTKDKDKVLVTDPARLIELSD